jgi:hypothetical protein
MKKGGKKSWSLLWEFGRKYFWFLVQNVKNEEGIRKTMRGGGTVYMSVL